MSRECTSQQLADVGIGHTSFHWNTTSLRTLPSFQLVRRISSTAPKHTASVFLLCGSRTLHLLPPNVQEVAPVNLPHTHTAFVDKNVSWGNWLNKQGKLWEPQLLEAVFVCCCCFKLHLGHFPPKYIESRFHIDFFRKFNFSYSLWQLYYESEKALSNSIVEYWNVNLWAPYLMK